MKNIMRSLILYLGPLCALSVGMDVDNLKTFSVIGKERPVLNAYGEAELLLHEGRGRLTHMWFGGDWPGYDQTVLRVYVDGEKRPSIEMELGLGHGIGFGDNAAPWGSEKMGKTGHPSGLYNTFKIPFGKSPELNPVELLWWQMRDKHLSNQVFKTVDQLDKDVGNA